MKIGSGQSCTRGFRFNNVVMEDVRLTSKAQSGEVTLQGLGFTYTAKSDFQGEDSFDVLVTGLINRIQGSSTIHMNVLVVGAPHRVAIQVTENNKTVMDLALNNARNIFDFYKTRGETVVIEIITYGPGLHMLRSDSPVKERIADMSLEYPGIVFAACGYTQAEQSLAEEKPVTLISEATVTPSGVVRLMELQDQGYAYIRP